jgi:hypothetical protein
MVRLRLSLTGIAMAEMVVEMAQNPRKHGWKDSGLMITEAEWWVYVYTMNEAMIIISTERLKRYINFTKIKITFICGRHK